MQYVYTDSNFVSECLSGLDAHTHYGYMIHEMTAKATVHIPYPRTDKGDKQFGKAFHHGRFVMALRKAARKEKK